MRFGFARLAALLALCAALAAPPAAAQVPDPYARQLAQQLARVDEFQSQYAFGRGAGPFAGALSARASRRFPITLRAGQAYRVVGVCDARCGDLDLKLYDPRGAVLAQDVAPDRLPLLQVSPGYTGEYAIEVTMAECGQSPCYFAFNVYSR